MTFFSAYKQILKKHIDPLLVVFRECVLNLLNLMILRNGKVKDTEFKSF